MDAGRRSASRWWRPGPLRFCGSRTCRWASPANGNGIAFPSRGASGWPSSWDGCRLAWSAVSTSRFTLLGSRRIGGASRGLVAAWLAAAHCRRLCLAVGRARQPSRSRVRDGEDRVGALLPRHRGLLRPGPLRDAGRLLVPARVRATDGAGGRAAPGHASSRTDSLSPRVPQRVHRFARSSRTVAADAARVVSRGDRSDRRIQSRD